MDWTNIHAVLLVIQRIVSCIGILIILMGVIVALGHFLYYIATGQVGRHGSKINSVRLDLGRVLILGLEFIVASDLIGTTTTPDYYSVGILAIIVAIRTLLSYSLNKEIADLSKK